MRKIARTFTPVNRSSDRLPEPTRRDQLEDVSRSHQLADANARLKALREQVVRSKTVGNSEIELSNLSLPTHLGWGSERLLRSAGNHRSSEDSAENTPLQFPTVLKTTSAEPTTQLPTTVALHPELTAAFLKNELSATARIWLLLRHIDVDGRGWVAIDKAREQLTSKGAALRVCGWRQLRNLLHAGSGTFWERDKQRIWLRSTAKVTTQLQIERLNRPITIPAKTLLANIQSVRATFYAIGHSGRNNPISRAKLADVTGVNERTQRRYDRVAHVQKTANYCLGEPTEQNQEQAWHQRHAAFDFVDKLGKHGKAGKTYRAFQLPNSYTVNYQAAAKGRTRKINQQLRQDLVNNRAQGNSRDQVERKRVFGKLAEHRKLFFDNGHQANKQTKDIYMKMQSEPHRAFWTHFE